MPYIKQQRRVVFEEITENIARTFLSNFQELEAGDLNYLFTVIAREYLASKGTSYKHFNDIIGALEGAKLELYRKTVVPYENIKIEENGDV